MNPRDEDLMCDVQLGRWASFDELVRRYRGPLLRLARSKVADAAAAEDVVQETFLAVFAARHTYQPDLSFRTWIWTILLNLCKRHVMRSARRPVSRDLTTFGEFQQLWHRNAARGSLQNLLVEERDQQLRSALTQLPEPQADALRLRFFGELKFEEIAAAMNCSLGGAKLRVKMGLIKLASLLSGDEEDES